MSQPKAFLTGIDTISRQKDKYIHRGIYSYNNLFYVAEINLDSNEKMPVFMGDIAEVYYTCAFVENDLLEVCFNIILVSPIIPTSPFSDIYYKTKVEAFMAAIEMKKKELPLRLDNMGMIKNFEDQNVKEIIKRITKEDPACRGFSNISPDNKLIIKNNTFKL